MQLTADNTAIVLDSTADLPDARERFPNWRMVPLYVRFGDESFKDYVELGPEQFYERLRTSPVTPSTSQPTPGDFAATYEELGSYERVYSLQVPETLSGTIQSARVAAAEHEDKIRIVDTGTASAAEAMLGFAIQRRLEGGTTDEEVDALIERYKRDAGLLFTVDTLEFLKRGGRIGVVAWYTGPVQMDMNLAVRSNVRIYAARGEGGMNCGRSLALMSAGKIAADPIITHHFTLDQIHEAFRTYVERIDNALKVVIHV